MSSPNGSVYQVVLSGQVRDQLKNLHRRAQDKGQGKRVLSAVKRIFAHLRTQPLRFGEPRYTLHHLNVEMRHGAVEPVWVQYAVHKERRIVFVRDLQPLLGSDF
jgi:hypothetical protein